LKQPETALRYDVVVLGGGPAGTATALSLRAHAPSLSLALIEQSHYESLRVGETLPPTVQPLLKQLGVWNSFIDEGHVPAYGTCTAWGSEKLSENEFIYHPSGRGWHLDRKRFDAMLARAVASKGVNVYAGMKFIDSGPGEQKHWRLKVQTENRNELTIEAAFVVDATGRRAVFASQRGIRKVMLDQLLGVSVFFALSPSHPSTATYTLVEACEEGWWYSAPVPEEKVAVFYVSDTDLVKRRRLNSSDAWFELLNQTHHIKGRVEHAAPLAAPRAHAAASQRLERMVGDAWLAVGDAATTFDPLSSQGVIKGLRTGIMAAYAIGDFLRGSSSSLEKYESVLGREFEAYLDTRADYYGQERRWENSPFWRRRHDRITLDPRQILQSSETARRDTAIEKLSMHLPVRDLKHLCQLCIVPRQAQAIVSEFKAQTKFTKDRRIILALQYLVEAELIESAAR
jgi:flavin-dependent dehydrogenase